MNEAYAKYLLLNPSATELNAAIGTKSWGVVRKTPSNLERYERCLTDREYAEAAKQALANRTEAFAAEIRAALGETPATISLISKGLVQRHENASGLAYSLTKDGLAAYADSQKEGK